MPLATTGRWPGMAVEHCRGIGNAYHRTDRDQRVSCICDILLELGRVLVDPRYDGQPPVQHTNQAGLICCHAVRGYSVLVSFTWQALMNYELNSGRCLALKRIWSLVTCDPFPFLLLLAFFNPCAIRLGRLQRVEQKEDSVGPHCFGLLWSVEVWAWKTFECRSCMTIGPLVSLTHTFDVCCTVCLSHSMGNHTPEGLGGETVFVDVFWGFEKLYQC